VASGIVVELIVPNETFWGVDLQLNKTIANRIRRASSVCLNLVADLDAGHIRQDSGAIEEVAGTVQQLQQRLKQRSKPA
jgi:hypothetical protein